MIDNEEIKEVYNLIMNYNKYIWDDRISKKDLEEWLNNFKGKVINFSKEKRIALDLLINFIYYNEKEIKYLCKNAYIMFRLEKIKDFISSGCSINDAELLFNKYLRKCRFSHIGRPSESGGYILYPFRKINKLPLHLFLKRWDEVNSDIESLILVDDFLGTGDTAVDFWNSPTIQHIIKRFPHIQLYYMVLVALKKGIDTIKNETNLNIICPQIFDEEYRVFSDKSTVFPDKKKRNIAKQVCENYGEYLEGKRNALGYKNSETLLGFHHNIPDNTLPIIWSDEREWYPIFKRERKIYGL